MSAKDFLERARSQKADEFYTQMETVESELFYYSPHFEGKVIYCNADHPKRSMFFRYFVNNFNKLNIKELICTYYRPFGFQEDGWLIPPPVVTRIKKVCGKIDNLTDLFNEENNNPKPKPLREDGDFRSSECIELLKESDVVVTNPPFSLSREFLEVLWSYDKRYLILGQQCQVGYKEIFKKLWNGSMKLGVNFAPHTWFRVPQEYEINTRTKIKFDSEGNKFFDCCGTIWLTNLDHKQEREFLPLVEKYDSKLYPRYINYDAIEVKYLKKIPCDYDGVMGVPITFMNRWNPKQFEIVGFKYGNNGKCLSLDGKHYVFSRVLVKRVN